MSYELIKPLIYPPVTVSDAKVRRCFANMWAVVTGASSGIGEALTLRLIDAGANVFLIARNGERLAELCSKAKACGCEAEYRATDLRNRDELDALCAELRQRLPAVAFLFCNAGKSINRKISDSVDRMHDFDRTMDLNYRSTVALSLALMPALSREAGHIIYTSSVSSLCCPTARGWSAYHASKCAANVWCRTARKEYSSLNVRVQVAYMPLVHTPMSDVNERYRNMPAYSADEGARILLRLAMSKKSCYKPWWRIFLVHSPF